MHRPARHDTHVSSQRAKIPQLGKDQQPKVARVTHLEEAELYASANTTPSSSFHTMTITMKCAKKRRNYGMESVQKDDCQTIIKEFL